MAEKSYEEAMRRSVALIKTLHECHKEELAKLIRTSLNKGVEVGRRLAREDVTTHRFVSVFEQLQNSQL